MPSNSASLKAVGFAQACVERVMSQVCHVQDGMLLFNCPGCGCLHGPKVEGEGRWTWNGDLVRPTVSPSILVRGTVPITDEEHARIMAGETVEPKPLVCHSFVRDGQIEFLSDCTHALAGKTVELEAWDRA